MVAASADASELSLDDGSGVLQLRLGKEPREAALALAAADGDDRRGCGGSAGGDDDMTDGSATQPPRQPPALLGLPLMVAGKLVVPAGGAAAPGAPFVRVAHVALLAPPNAEPLWGLELVEAWRDLYTSGAAAP